MEHCGISPQSRPRSHLRQVYFARYCLTFSKSCRAQKNRVDIAELLPQLSCLPNSPRNALSSSYHILATLFYSATESSVTCQTLLGLEDASKSKPQLVSPMFKGMEGRSMHVIGIIKNGYNPTDCHEPILSYQPSWSFGVLIAFSNSVLCLSTQMRVCHMRTLIGHWLQGNLHAEHFLLVTRPKPPFL